MTKRPIGGKAKKRDAAQTVGDRLRLAREARRLSLSEVAERLHLSKAAIGAWEVDRNMPVYKHLYLAADLYRTTADWLMRGEGMPPAPEGSSGAPVFDPQGELQQTLATLKASGFEPTEITPVEGGRYNIKFKPR
jgi:transcriptional regulator with XRE-family HTH domain